MNQESVIGDPIPRLGVPDLHANKFWVSAGSDPGIAAQRVVCDVAHHLLLVESTTKLRHNPLDCLPQRRNLASVEFNQRSLRSDGDQVLDVQVGVRHRVGMTMTVAVDQI
jgi:hypothetical protein